MAITFTTTLGSSSANSYVTVAEADDYFATRWTTEAWEDLDDSDKERALMAATRQLDRETFLGYPATSTQRLKWPRLDVRKVDSADAYGYGATEYLATELPQQLKDAACELAYALISATNTETAGRKVTRWKSDDQEFEYESDGRASNALPTAVMELLAPFLRGARLVRA